MQLDIRSKLYGDISPDRPLVVAALTREARHISPDIPVLITGVGYLATASALQEVIREYGAPREIINVGTAGALTEGLEGFNRVSSVSMFDFDHQAIDSFLGYSTYPTIELGGSGVKLASGGTFVAGGSLRDRLAQDFDLVDMEGYAVAYTALRMSLPVAVYKYVSDMANEQAGADWNERMDDHARAIAKGLEGII